MNLRECMDEAGRRLGWEPAKCAAGHLNAEMNAPGAFGYANNTVVPPGHEEKLISAIANYISAKIALADALEPLPDHPHELPTPPAPQRPARFDPEDG